MNPIKTTNNKSTSRKRGTAINQINLSFNNRILTALLFLCLFTTLMQGIPSLANTSRSLKLALCLILFAFLIVFVLLSLKKGSLTEEKMTFAIIFTGMLFHCSYVLLSGLYDRQHDEGFYTGIATTQVNPGHIGYIEYIYKFRKLPDMNPYELFSYYHPPLHYVISGLWLILLTSLGMTQNLAFENLQILPLLYSGLFMLVSYHILKITGACKKALYAGLFLVAMHPALTIMSGSVNNDMLSTLLLSCSILTTLRWLRDKNLKNLILLALSIGFGMLCKINTVLIAFPVGILFLIDFIQTIRTKNRQNICRSVKNYVLFGLTSGAIGLSFIIRNLLKFHVKPGISSATETSVMYTGDYSLWARLGIPAFSDWHFSFPFHPLSGDVIHNTWVIMFQTSLFAEEFPVELTGIPLFLCQFTYIAAILFATGSGVLFLIVQCLKLRTGLTKTTGLEALFLSTGYLTFLISFAAFSIKYPYTCSSDFRYIIICLVYIAIGLADSSRLLQDKASLTGRSSAMPFCLTAVRIICAGVCIVLILTTIIYMTWNRW